MQGLLEVHMYTGLCRILIKFEHSSKESSKSNNLKSTLLHQDSSKCIPKHKFKLCHLSHPLSNQIMTPAHFQTQEVSKYLELNSTILTSLNRPQIVYSEGHLMTKAKKKTKGEEHMVISPSKILLIRDLKYLKVMAQLAILIINNSNNNNKTMKKASLITAPTI